MFCPVVFGKCDHLIGEEEACYFAFGWFVMSSLVCLLFYLVSLVVKEGFISPK